MGIAFLDFIDQLVEIGHFITALEKIDITKDLYFQSLHLEQEVIKEY